MSSSIATTTTWVMATVAVAGGIFVAVQQLKPKEEPLREVVVVQEIAPPIKVPPIAEIVRIDDGMATIAGNGNPGEEIVIMDGDNVLVRTKIQSDGTFALVFDYSAPQEGALLEIGEDSGDGELLKAEKSIVVLPKNGEKNTIASLDGDAIEIEFDNREQLKFAGIVYDEGDAATISGYSTPNTDITIMINQVELAQISSGETGQWSYKITSLPFGSHELKLVTSDQQVLTTELIRETTSQMAKIRAGDSLWRIAESAFGDGARYVDIYNLNAEKITDPNLIYPDQEIIIQKR